MGHQWGYSHVELRLTLQRYLIPNSPAPFFIERAGDRQYERVHLVAPVNVFNQPLNRAHIPVLAQFGLIHRESFLVCLHFGELEPLDHCATKALAEWNVPQVSDDIPNQA